MREPLPTNARDAIRSRRIELGYSQPQAAKAAGVSITTWNGAEKGRSNPQPLQRAAICRILRWTPDSIDRLEVGQPAVINDTPAASAAPVEPVSSDDSDAAERESLAARIRRLEAVVHHLAGERAMDEWGNGKQGGR